MPSPHPALFRAKSHGFVDFSEDVSSKDIVSAAQEGYDSAELAKRYTTATMGPAQGKLETVNTVAVLAEATGRSIAETGTTVWRPRTSRSAWAPWPGGTTSRSGTPRCSPGTRHTGPHRLWPGSGSGPTTTATPKRRSATSGKRSGSST